MDIHKLVKIKPSQRQLAWQKLEFTAFFYYGSGKPYDDFFSGQLEELFTRYGKLYSLWFDGAFEERPGGKKQIYAWELYYGLIRRCRNDAIIAISGPSVCWIGNEAGEVRDSEWSVVSSRMKDTGKISRDLQQKDDSSFREKPIKFAGAYCDPDSKKGA